MNSDIARRYNKYRQIDRWIIIFLLELSEYGATWVVHGFLEGLKHAADQYSYRLSQLYVGFIVG